MSIDPSPRSVVSPDDPTLLCTRWSAAVARLAAEAPTEPVGALACSFDAVRPAVPARRRPALARRACPWPRRWPTRPRTVAGAGLGPAVLAGIVAIPVAAAGLGVGWLGLSAGTVAIRWASGLILVSAAVHGALPGAGAHLVLRGDRALGWGLCGLSVQQSALGVAVVAALGEALGGGS